MNEVRQHLFVGWWFSLSFYVVSAIKNTQNIYRKHNLQAIWVNSIEKQNGVKLIDFGKTPELISYSIDFYIWFVSAPKYAKVFNFTFVFFSCCCNFKEIQNGRDLIKAKYIKKHLNVNKSDYLHNFNSEKLEIIKQKEELRTFYYFPLSI